MDFHENIRMRLKNIRESLQRERNTISTVEDKDKVKDNGKKRRKKKRRK